MKDTNKKSNIASVSNTEINKATKDDFDTRWDAKFGTEGKSLSVDDFLKEFEEMRNFK